MKIAYTSKRVTKSYKSGQGKDFKSDFDAAAQPVESEGFCHRQLTSLASFINSRSDLCGRVAKISSGVGFLVQIEFIESAPTATNWSWYLGLPFRVGSGGLVALDGQIVQDFMGVTTFWGNALSKALKVDMQLAPGPHVLQIYGLSQNFETSSVLFSRDGSTPIAVSINSIASELLKWVAVSDADPSVAAAAQKERAPTSGDVARRVSTLQLQRLATDAQYAVRLRSVANANCRFTDSFNSSSRVSIAYLPASAVTAARSTELTASITQKGKWDVLPGLATSTLSRSTTGVFLCTFTGRFFIDDTTAKSFSLDFAFALNRSSWSTAAVASQFRLDNASIQPSGAALDYSTFIELSDTSSSNFNVSLSYNYTGAKSAKIVGGRITAAFLPGASLVSIKVDNAVVSRSANVFSRDVQVTTPSTLIVRVSGVICRNAASEQLLAQLSKSNSAIYDGVYFSVSSTVALGGCEPLVMHAVVDASVGSNKISLDVTTSTKAGYQMRSITAQIVVVDRGALLSLDACTSACAQHNLCKAGIYSSVSSACNLFMMQNQSKLLGDATKTTFLRAVDPGASENVWTTLQKRRWELTSSNPLLLACKDDTCASFGCAGARTIADRCRCVCRATSDCMGISYENEKCYQITSNALRQTILSKSYAREGKAAIHLNVPKSCSAIKGDAVKAASGMYVIATNAGFVSVYCDMVADAGKGYTLVPCDFGSSDVACRGTTGPSDFDSCKEMGLTQVVPRTSNHFIAMHRRYGSYFFATVPGVSNAVLNTKLELPSDNSATSQWSAHDSGKWWLRDIVSSDDDSIPVTNRAAKRLWLGMHAYADAQSVGDGIMLSFDSRGIQTVKYLCSTNDATPSTIWRTVIQDSFNGNRDDNLWVTSWGNAADKWDQICQGITILGGLAFTRSNAYVEKTVGQLNKGLQASNVRIRFTYYFAFKPNVWSLLQRLIGATADAKVIRIFLGTRLVREESIDDSNVYYCNEKGRNDFMFYRARKSFVVRGVTTTNGAVTLRFAVDFGSNSVLSFGIDEVSMEMDFTFQSPTGLSPDNPATSCAQLKDERVALGDPNPDGRYYIQLNAASSPVYVPCSNGWLVAQRRLNGNLGFNRKWKEYRDGFGLGSSSEWWIGNDLLATITRQSTEAMVVLSKAQVSTSAYYADLRVAGADEKYLLRVRGYDPSTSTAADALTALNNSYFSTPDQDNDRTARYHCARRAYSGFWYNDCFTSKSDLNAPYQVVPACASFVPWARGWCQRTGGIVWQNADGYDSSTLLLRASGCAYGFYYLTATAGSTSGCTACPAGTFGERHAQACTSCPTGTYNPVAGGAGAAACLSCPAGSYCTLGSATPLTCVAGTYSSSGAGTCAAIPEGFAGAHAQLTPQELVACTNGTYSAPGQTHCSPVPAGFTCSSSTTACGLRDLVKCESARVYCPRGNVGQLIVPPGYYSVGARSAILRCPPGHFCQNGARKKCPATRFGVSAGLSHPLCSGRCAVGCVCALGSVSACPATASSAAQVVVAPAAISYALAPLTMQPSSTSESDTVMASVATNIETIDLFEFKDVNASRFSTSWSGGVAHNVTVSYFERATTSQTCELQLPVAGFDWGLQVRVDGNVVVAKVTASAVSFAFVSTPGPHQITLLGFESSFRAKRSMLYRKYTATASSSAVAIVPFESLRCDTLDTQPIFLDVDATICGSVAPGCTTSVLFNGKSLREVSQGSNLLLMITASGRGVLATSAAVDASTADQFVAELASSSTGDLLLVIGVNVRTGALSSRFIAALLKYGASSNQATADLAGSFVFIGEKGIQASPWTEFTMVGAGSSYRLQTSVPLLLVADFYAPVSVPSGYYSIPEAAPSHRRSGFRKCPDGYSCTNGERSVTMSFANAAVCSGQKQQLNIPEATTSYVSTLSFALASAPASVKYQLILDTASSGPAPVSSNPFTLNGDVKVTLTQVLDYETLSQYNLVLIVNDTVAGLAYSACKIQVSVVDVNELPSFVNAGFTVRTKENTLPPVVLLPRLTVFDPDAFDSFTFAIVSGSVNGNFVMNAYGNVVIAKALDFETQKSYTLSISVTDLGGLSALGVVTIVVEDVPEPPKCTAGSFSIREDAVLLSVVGELSGLVFDPDVGDTLTYTLVSQSYQGAISVSASTGSIVLQKSLNFEAQDSMSFRIKFTDSTDRYDTCDFTIAVLDVNEDPVLYGGVFDVVEACSGDDCLIGDLMSFASDEDSGTTFTFTLKNSSSMVSIVGSQLWAIGQLDYETTPTLYVSVQVSDGGGGSAVNTMTVYVVDVNETPTGVPFSVSVPENQLTGAVVYTLASPDPEGDVVDHTLINSTSGFLDLFALDDDEIVVTAAIDYEALSTRTFTLFVRACDSLGLCSDFGPNIVKIIDGPDAPVFGAAMDATVEENVSPGALIGMPVTAVDQDAGQTATLVYDIYSGDPFRQFSISASSGQLSLLSKLDVNIVQTYSLVIRSTDTDGMIGLSDAVLIEVLDSPSPPFFVDTFDFQSYYPIDISRLSDSSYGVISLTVDDRDPDQVGGICSIQTDTSSKFMVVSNEDFTVCNVSSKPGAVLTTGTRYNVTLRVTDTEDSTSYSQIVLGIMSRGLNNAPQCTNARLELMENTASGSLVGKVVGSDKDAGDTVSFAIMRGNDYDMFQINDTTGAITVGTNISDYEACNLFILTVGVQDDAPAPLTSQCTVVVVIQNEIEPPVCSASMSFSITENNAPNALVGTTLWPICTDQDTKSRTSTSFLFEIQDANSEFAISRATGQLSARRGLNFEVKSSYSVSILVRNVHSEKLSTVLIANIQVLDMNDPPQAAFSPAYPGSSVTVANLPESAPVKSVVGYLSIADEDVGDSFTVTLVDLSLVFALVRMNETSYQLVTADSVDFETRSLYAVSVVAKDRAGSPSRVDFTVKVLNVSEAPFFVPGQQLFIEENTARRTIAKQRFQYQGACNYSSNVTTRLGVYSTTSSGVCLQRCSGQALCKSVIFDTAASTCVLLKEASATCAPCSTCQRHDLLAGGKSLSALSITAANQFVYRSSVNVSVAAASGFTLEFWLRIGANEGTIVSYSKSAGSKTRRIFQVSYLQDSLRAVLYDISVTTKAKLTTGVWYHIAVTFDGLSGDAILFLDGILFLQTRIPSLGGSKCDSSGELVVGSCFSSVACPMTPFVFTIDEVRTTCAFSSSGILRYARLTLKLILFSIASVVGRGQVRRVHQEQLWPDRDGQDGKPGHQLRVNRKCARRYFLTTAPRCTLVHGC